ncbi:MAG: hypothetical protein ACREPQ_14200 [Rhodanobacter sp.]
MSNAADTLPNLDPKAQAVLLGALRLIEIQLSTPYSIAERTRDVMLNSARAALADHDASCKGVCIALASDAYRAYSGK